MEPGFGLFDEGEEQDFELGGKKAHLSVVDFRGNVVDGSVTERS
jgi:hypothetical protein